MRVLLVFRWSQNWGERFSGLSGLVGSDHIVYNEAVREQVHGVHLQKSEGTYVKDDIL